MRCYNGPVADMGVTIVETCPARAALAGNPSDGYGGSVLAVPVASIAATVTVRRADRWVIADESSRIEFDDWSSCRAAGARADAGTPHALVLATIGAAGARIRAVPPLSIEVSTTIPRSVGLAGSSAIVIALLRALWRTSGHAVPAATQIAREALAVEVDRLGITAGLQDRVVQAHAEPMMMHFGTGVEEPFRPIRPLFAPLLVVASRTATAESSHVVHRSLRERFEAGEPEVVRGLASLGPIAERAAAAYLAGDLVALGQSMDATFEVRRELLRLDPRHLEMVDVARGCGAAVNSTGSGGSIVALAPNESVERKTRLGLSQIGCDLFDV